MFRSQQHYCRVVSQNNIDLWLFAATLDFLFILHTHGHYMKQKSHAPHCSEEPKSSVNIFQDIRGNIWNNGYSFTIVKEWCLFLKINTKWNVCELAVPFVNSVKEASYVDELFTKGNLSTSMSLKKNVPDEVTVNFIWNQRIEDDCAVFLTLYSMFIWF